MGPDRPLPYSGAFFSTAEDYVDSLLDFLSTDSLLRTLCGGVHVLDAFTSNPPLYTHVLPQEWRDFFAQYEIMDILDLLMREELDHIDKTRNEWRTGPLPPQSLLDYITNVRKHLLLREPAGSQCARNRAMKPTQKLARQVAVGMNVKKVHEVGLFARYIADLTTSIASSSGKEISHLVDFGSGQNYLGRALASEPYNQRIVAIESKSHNAERAKEYDILAKLAEKKVVIRNKKAFRAGLEGPGIPTTLPTPPPELTPGQGSNIADPSLDPAIEASSIGHGRIQYVDHLIRSGDLADVVDRIGAPSPNLLVMSLHSCGNLVHHGLRSLIVNPNVKAVAMVGCCYNLLTERLGPATYKMESLRPSAHDRCSNDGDPDGFPMSARLCRQPNLKLNITARMMAVQAPENWGSEDSEAFFTRHYYRALLQRIFLDHGIVGPPTTNIGAMNGEESGASGFSPAGHSSAGTPILLGSLRKSCYTSFNTYVRGALAKLCTPSSTSSTPEEDQRTSAFQRLAADLTDGDIEDYAHRFRQGKKELSILWSLMAFSARVVEAAIVVDRWVWLKEQQEEGKVRECWVEAVFGYKFSPRNLVVVGVK